jgi:hypothetical protein
VKLHVAMIGGAAWAALAAGQNLTCDLSGYRTQEGLEAQFRAGVLELRWRVSAGRNCGRDSAR